MMKNTTIWNIIFILVICIGIIQCKPSTLDKGNQNKVSISRDTPDVITSTEREKVSKEITKSLNEFVKNIQSSESKLSFMNYFNGKEGRFVHESMIFGQILSNAECIPIRYDFGFPLNQTHSVSGNLYGEMSGDKNFISRSNQNMDCVYKYNGGDALIIAEYFVKIPNDVRPNDSRIICKLFEEGSELEIKPEVFSIEVEFVQDTFQFFKAFETNKLVMANFIFCEIDSNNVYTNNLYAKVFVRLKFTPVSNLDGTSKNYDLFFAIVEEHSPLNIHSINAQEIEGSREIIDEVKIKSLSTMSLDELKNLNNGETHLADHIEIISFKICDIPLSFPPPIIGQTISSLDIEMIAN